MEAVSVSAPGKVILHGEHSVVYGRRAVALSLDLRTTLTLTPGGARLELDLPEVEIQQAWPLQDVEALWERLGRPGEKCAAPLTEAQVAQVRDFLGLPEDPPGGPRGLALLSFFQLYLAILPRPVPATLRVTSQLPTGAGLGSSAAYAVCLSAALLRLAERGSAPDSVPSAEVSGGLSLKEVSGWAFRSEQIVHGTPSGIDNSICTYGGAVSFKAGCCSPLGAPPLRVLLVNTRVPRSTKALVAAVGARRSRLPEVVEPVLDAMDALAERALQTLSELSSAASPQQQDEAYAALHELVDINQALLASLGVSHASLERLVGVAAAHGLHAKLTGAGGGGLGMVVLGRDTAPEAVDKCRGELEAQGYQVWQTTLGAPGLTFH
ncbi:mevalonate kinase-like [Portunus trituberculatus]|uniref:mevalonate kinase-like n=1 Tax=Portunus trituberculatus TaxID=210409 RepID=UPI001E1CD730|nr:mevalonate kinase-like [Portunus trituberculatus]XP_045126427.1 mevalonate kinase-like [Portunus trituberculatus]